METIRIIGAIYGLQGYTLGLYGVYIGGNIGIMEKKMETAGIIEVIYCRDCMDYGVYLGVI